MERRLAAIVAADVVGYSRMIRLDETGTLAALRTARADVVDPAIAENRGRIVKLMGDGILVEFASAVDAVTCAVIVQRTMLGWNSDRPEDRRITFRVGINLGDVVIDGGDIHGDGVNVAARLESLAAPGSVCVSSAVHDQVRDRLDLSFDDLGGQELKNIDRPVQVWQWTDGVEALQTLPEDVVLQLPEKPSIAVLPFDNMSGDPEQEYFADGIAEDVITALSRHSDLFVIARNSSFTYRGKAVDIRMVGKDLGVRFVLEGSVRRAGNRVRITAQLIEAATGNHVWAERYDGPVDDIFDVQDEITMNVAGAVGSEIRAADVRASAEKRFEDLQSWERLMKAYWHIYRYNPEDNAKGQAICRAEIQATGGSAAIHSAVVMACMFELLWGLGNRSPMDVIKDGTQAAHAAIALDPNNEGAHANLSLLLWASGDHDGAVREATTAVNLSPHSFVCHLSMGMALAFSGPAHCDSALEHLKMAARLGPRDINIDWVYAPMSVVAFQSGSYSDAINYAHSAIRQNPGNGSAYRFLAASLARDGQLDQAKTTWARAWEIQPLEMTGYVSSLHRMYKRGQDAENMIDAMRQAGAVLP